MPYHILIATTLSSGGLAVFDAATDVKAQVIPSTWEAILNALTHTHALIIGDDMQVDEEILDKGRHLKVIGRPGTSLVDIDIDEATRRGIILMNTPGVDAVTAAEYTFTLILAIVRNIVAAHNHLSRGVAARNLYQGTQLKGKTLGLIGFGRVGRQVMHRAEAFGMNILAYDPYVSESEVTDLKMKLVGFSDLLSRADIISLHTSVTSETFDLINADTIARMKKGVYLINTTHDSLVNEEALLAALDSGQIAGFAVDFHAPDTDGEKSALIGHPRVIHTPHLRTSTLEAQHDLSVRLAEQILDALRETGYRNAINLPFTPEHPYETIRPYLHLAECIGILQHYLARAPISRVEIQTNGDEMQGLVKPLTVAILQGMLSRNGVYRQVNYVNAPLLAAEQGIFVTQAKGLDNTSYHNLLTCRVNWSGKGDMLISGALFDQTEPRIVQVDQYRTDFSPAGTLLIMGSYDIPGVIGKAGTFMAQNKINIAGWRTSRVEKGGATLSIITIDESLSEEMLDELRGMEFVRHALQITF